MGKKIYIGIDPGKTGAAAFVDDSGFFVRLVDFSDPSLLDTFAQYECDIAAVYLEQVHSMPGQGVVSTFSFGENFGFWKGFLHAFEIEPRLIAPQTWMKKVGIVKSDKRDKPGLLLARELFPSAPLALKKHHNRADALLIAYTAYQDGINDSQAV